MWADEDCYGYKSVQDIARERESSRLPSHVVSGPTN